ncbi:MAG: hypothetical protein WBL25_10485 [Anaerolineales bacterium]
MRRDYIFWGAVLILLGGLMFLNSADIRLPRGINPMQLFWPSVLILLGCWIMFGYFLRGNVESEQVSIDLQGANQAALKLSHGAGRIIVGSGAAPGQLLSGSFGGGVKHSAHRSGDRLDAHLESQPFAFPPFIGGWQGQGWNFNLNRDIPIALKLETGASQSELDLRDLKVTDLKVSTGASKTDITLPANAGMTTVKIELGAASLDMVVPQGVEARIRAEQGVSAIEIDTKRFPYSNGIYESADYSTAQNKVDVKIEAGAGRVAVH